MSPVTLVTYGEQTEEERLLAPPEWDGMFEVSVEKGGDQPRLSWSPCFYLRRVVPLWSSLDVLQCLRPDQGSVSDPTVRHRTLKMSTQNLGTVTLKYYLYDGLEIDIAAVIL